MSATATINEWLSDISAATNEAHATEDEFPLLIYLLGPVAVLKRAEHGFSWTQSIR